MRKTIKITIGVIVAILVIGVIGYRVFNNQSAGTTKPGAADNSVVKVGYIGPLTGDASALGIDAAKSIELAVEQVNANGGIHGKQIKLYEEDDQYNTAKSVTAYEKLVNVDGVDTIIMSTYGGVMALGERAEKDNVLIIDSLDCDQDIAKQPENVFCIAKETKDLADVIADFALEKGYKNVGILHSSVDSFMPSVAMLFKERAGDRINVQIESYPPGTTDFKTSLLKFKNSEAIVPLGYDEIGIAVKQARELGMSQPFLTIPSVATTPSIQAASNKALDGTCFSF